MEKRMAVVSFMVTTWIWVVPATLAAGVIALVVELLRLIGVGPWYVWILLLPTLYLCWLVAFLFFCGRSIRPMARRFPKPRRAIAPGQPGRLRTVIASALRKQVIDGLPLVPFLKSLRWGSRLVILGYSPSLHIGERVNLTGTQLEDPDLTELGDDVLLGTGVTIAAHFWKCLPSGKKVYVSAPVKVGARTTLGVHSMIALGCTIGEDAIIEPHSYLPPYTEVPAGEMWGGRPAVFQRRSGDF